MSNDSQAHPTSSPGGSSGADKGVERPSSPTSSLSLGTSHKRPMFEIIGDPLENFDFKSAIVEPFLLEAKREERFREQFADMLIELMLEAHAWSVHRTFAEDNKRGTWLDSEITELKATEERQGTYSSSQRTPSFIEQTRLKMAAYFQKMKAAIAYLLYENKDIYGCLFGKLVRTKQLILSKSLNNLPDQVVPRPCLSNNSLVTMKREANHCSFVLLAEFDIDRGAQLTYQFPQPLGTDESLLANLMLPDGAEKQLEDWTIFFLNQTPFNTIAPVLALENGDASRSQGETFETELLYVLNLVRTKHDKTVRRGAVVKAMAICTRHPFIQIFKPVLLMALDDYFTDPSQDCLARLFDAVNSMDLTAAPVLTRHEKLVMRSSERKDIFVEKFARINESLTPNYRNPEQRSRQPGHQSTNSGGSHSSLEEGIVMQNKDRDMDTVRIKDRMGTPSSVTDYSQLNNGHHPSSIVPGTISPSDASFSLGGSAVWVGDESGIDQVAGAGAASTTSGSTESRGRTSVDASSTSSHTREHTLVATPLIPSFDTNIRAGAGKDTHFYTTTISYKGHKIPIKMPLSTFPEEVGDYSLITLIQAFPASSVTITGPLHPHLHTNGSMTHPIIILFNALVTGKRIIFLGHNRPAGLVSSFVLSACALGSGCGAVLRGFIERAFPYANLTTRDEWEKVPAYIAGVTNPIFESSGSWDLLLDVTTSRVVVSKDIHCNFPLTATSSIPPVIPRSGTVKAESSLTGEDDFGRATAKGDYTAKADSGDNLFIEDVIAAISYHFGEGLVRMRFSDYVARFVRLSAKYEEEISGSTKLGYQSTTFTETPLPQLGSGIVFTDEQTCARELLANTCRIEGWRRTNTYKYCIQDFSRAHAENAIKGFDVVHQLFRLRHVRNLSDSEVELIMRTIAVNVQTYAQVVELLSYLPTHASGLQPLSFGLFHPREDVREHTIDIFNELRQYPVGVLFLQALNHFQRYAYVRQAHAREVRMTKDLQYLNLPSAFSRTPTNRSESSLGA